MEIKSKKEWANEFVSRGWSIIPVGPDKLPIIPGWREFQKTRPSEEQIDLWLEQKPDLNWAVLTGELSNLTVIDVEAEGDLEMIKDFTLSVRTGGGGIHKYFEYDSDFKNAVRILPQCDIRSQGGYVLSAGSTSEKGSYDFLNKMPVKKMSQVTKDMFIKDGKRLDIFKVGSQVKPEDSLVNSYEGAGQGCRNDEMARFIGKALKVIHPALWTTKAWELILEANEKNDPPLPINELNATFQSIKGRDIAQAVLNSTTGLVGAPGAIPKAISVEGDEVKMIHVVADEQSLNQDVPYPLQMPIFDDVLEGGLNKGDVVVVAAQTGQGKCVGRGTPMIMFDGSIKKVEEIKKGDLLMGPDSKPKKVLSTTKGREEMYKIDQIKGDSYTVNKSHILSLKTTGNCNTRKYKGSVTSRRNTPKGKIVNISVDEYLKKSTYFKHIHKGWSSQEINFPEKKILLDPYFLGLWLGDGTSSLTEITTMDKEVVSFCVNYVKFFGLDTHCSDQKNNKSKRYNFSRGENNTEKKNRLLLLMRKMNLINNKHIPEEYKINSSKVRMQLLAGLLDTDGHLTCNGFEIVQKNKKIIEDIAFIGRSLGFRCQISKKIGTIKKINFKGEYWRLTINGDCERIPTRVAHKKAGKRKQKKDVLVNGIEVTPIGIGDYYGFELDGDGLFLLGDFTVTHNTTIAQDWTLSFLRGPRKASSLWFSYEVMVKYLWKKFQTMGMTEDDCAVIPAKHTSGNISWVEEKVKEAKEKFGIEIVVIDHLGFLLPKTMGILGKNVSMNQASLITQTMRDLKQLAIQEEIIIILPVHTRKTNSMDQNDIANSAGIAQEADAVFLLEREKASGGKDATEYFTPYTKITLSKNRKTGMTPSAWFDMINNRFAYSNRNEEIKKVNDTWNDIPEKVVKPVFNKVEKKVITEEKEMDEVINSMFK